MVMKLRGGHILLKNPLQDHSIERPVTHSSVVLNQIGFGVRGKINCLLFSQTVMRRKSFSPLFRPQPKRLLVNVQAPKFDDRSVLKNPPAIIADSSSGS